MKTKNKKLVKSSNTNNLLRKTFERNKMVSVKNTKVFLRFVTSLSWRVVLLSTMCSIESSRNRMKMIHNFARYLVSLNKKHGPDFVIAYLKASQLAISKYLAQEPLNTLRDVNPDYIFPRLASGLPKIIGPLDRIALRHNNRKTIILWMSIFGLFRVLMGTYKLKLATITNPFSGCEQFLAEKSVNMSRITRDALRALPLTGHKQGLKELSTEKLLLFTTSSPSSKVSWKGVVLDVANLRDMGILDPMLRWLTILRSPLKSHLLTIRDKVLPVLEDGTKMDFTCARIAYVRSPEGPILMTRLWRLKAISGSSDQKPEERIIPFSSIFHKVYVDDKVPRNAPNFVYPTETSLKLKDPYIIKSSWEVPAVSILPLSDINKDMEVLFITTPSTPLEREAATFQTDPITAAHKNEFAVGQVGQVQFVKEAAGKLRVFAMVDVWTQSIMQPVHRLLTNILRSLPNDGTLNQTLSYERARQKSIKYGKSYGYDLSAATDRLPIKIQVSILRGIFIYIGIDTNIAVELSLLWKEILVNRPFRVPKLPKGVEDPQELEGSHVYYEVGQPMGALSSFNMLALTHHMIMQDIAQSLGMKGWCELYEITGDDIVIFDSSLALKYVEYMASLGLELNLKKSVVSVKKAAGEYLKKTWIKDIDVSMVSWKQLYQNHSTLMGRVSDALYFLQKWNTHKHSVPAVVRRAALTWTDLKDHSREQINIPLLALLSTALRQSKLPLEKFFLFLMGQKDRSLEFKSLYSQISGLKVKQEEIQLFLTQFFKKEEIKFPSTKDWEKREIAFSGPLRGLRLGVIDQIMKLQEKLHGKGIDSSRFPKQESMPDIFSPGVSMSTGFKFSFSRVTEPMPMTLLSTKWVKDQINLLIDAISLSGPISKPKPPSKPGGWSYDQRWALEELVNELIIQPAIAGYSKSILKILPKLHPARPFIAEKDLQNLSLDQLLDIMDQLVNLETMLMTHKIQDQDRRLSHKASLSILSKIKPAKTVHPENFGFMGMGFGGGFGLKF